MAPEMVIKMPYKLIGGVFRRGAAPIFTEPPGWLGPSRAFQPELRGVFSMPALTRIERCSPPYRPLPGERLLGRD